MVNPAKNSSTHHPLVRAKNDPFADDERQQEPEAEVEAGDVVVESTHGGPCGEHRPASVDRATESAEKNALHHGSAGDALVEADLRGGVEVHQNPSFEACAQLMIINDPNWNTTSKPYREPVGAAHVA